VLETLLAVAPLPGHLLNAEALHKILKRLSMPGRDVVWSIPTYFALDGDGALDRLIRWSARSPHPDCPDEVAELAAVTVIWTFTSPNRRMRDYATKALTKLLSERLSVLPSIVQRFDGVNDKYPDSWRAIWSRGDSEPMDLEVYPAWAEYHWEGNVLDCSIEHTVFGLVGDWTQIDGVASLAGNQWNFGRRRLKRCSVRE
jgi:hypothetical protein